MDATTATATPRLTTARSALGQAVRDAMSLDDHARHLARLTLLNDVRKVYPTAAVLHVITAGEGHVASVLDARRNVLAGFDGEDSTGLSQSVQDKALILATPGTRVIDLEAEWVTGLALEHQIEDTEHRIVPRSAAEAALGAARQEVYAAAQAALVEAISATHPTAAFLTIDTATGHVTGVFDDQERLLSDGTCPTAEALDALVAFTEPGWLHGSEATGRNADDLVFELEDLARI